MRRGTSSPGCTREPRSTGTAFTGEWHDIGDARQLLEADNRLREQAGMPVRSEYAVD